MQASDDFAQLNRKNENLVEALRKDRDLVELGPN